MIWASPKIREGNMDIPLEGTKSWAKLVAVKRKVQDLPVVDFSDMTVYIYVFYS
jgi:hypothetical protein